MRVWELQQFSIDDLRVADRADAEPGPGEAAIGVRAVSLNYRDWLMVIGDYNPRQPLPLIPCSDGAGEVIAVGPGVTRVKPGDRVMGAFSQTWIAGPPTREKLRGTLGGPLDGMLAERIVLPAEGLVHVPAYLSDVEAATLPCAAVTAWHALVEEAPPVAAGDTVLVQGTGGVSIFALQVARLHGARVIVTSSSDGKLERARALGAWQTINYSTTPDWDKAARAFTGGAGVDHIIEVGGAGTFGRSLRAVRVGGTVTIIGVLAGKTADVTMTLVLMQNLRLQGNLVGSREMFTRMTRAFEQHELALLQRPVDEQRAIGRDAGAGQCRRLLERQVIGDAHQILFVGDDDLRQHAVDVAAAARRCGNVRRAR
jgi:NADPH:quinone reductase-like Zn-dependent oxidoreductase